MEHTTNRKRRLATVCLSAILGAATGCTVLTSELVTMPDSRFERVEDEQLEKLVRLNKEIQRVQEIVLRYAPKRGCPAKLASLIVGESRRASVDPLFITAVVKSESTFRSYARSRKNAHGLMQITRITEREARKHIDVSEIKSRVLSDPHYNLRLGIGYLKQLNARFNGDMRLALVAYNWGPTRLEKAQKRRRRFPGEVSHYADQILRNHRAWAQEG